MINNPPVAIDNFPNAIAGTTEEISANTERTPVDTSYVKIKSIRIGRNGTYTLSWEQKTYVAGKYCRTKVYKNGVAHGIEHETTADAYAAITEDLAFSAGDTAELWGYMETGGTYLAVQKFSVQVGNTRTHKVITD